MPNLTVDEWRTYAEMIHPELGKTGYTLTVVHGEGPEPTISAVTEDNKKFHVAMYVGG